MKKTIEEVAKENCNKKFLPWAGDDRRPAYISGFIDGVKLAQSWIPFDKELPEIGVDILLKSKNGNTSTYIPKNSDGIKWCSERFILWRTVERL